MLSRPITSVRRLTGLALLALLTTSSAKPTLSAVAPTAGFSRDAVAGELFKPQAKLRRLHLVRPDLILYPIKFDVFC
ncbi:MAG: hypothetical protein QM770_18215 [Tepidisphaeraceae bacterium]